VGTEWDGWSELHGGIRPSPLVRGWLRLVHGLARSAPVARVPPDVLSGMGVAAAAGALAAAAARAAAELIAVNLTSSAEDARVVRARALAKDAADAADEVFAGGT
jgi:hypothetical protein